MKHSIFFSFLIFTSLFCNAQIEYDDLQKNDQIKLRLKFELAEIPFKDFFSRVFIIDAREDSSEVGYYSIGTKGSRPKLYRILPSTKEGVAEWITKYLGIRPENTSSSATLLIVIKKLWLSSEAVPSTNGNDKQMQPGQLDFDPGLVTKLEFYLEKDSSFYPIYKIDSVFTYNKELHKYADFYITESLKHSLKKLFNTNFAEVLKRGRKLSIGEIEASNNKSAGAKILNTTGFKKGVYKNFAEFATNTPSMSDYNLISDKLGDVLHVKENGSEYPMRNAWGFCNGTELYINSGDKYFKLIKTQNTFYFAGIRGIKRKSSHDLLTASFLNLATNTGRKHTKYSTIIKYYKVDMETGEVY